MSQSTAKADDDSTEQSSSIAETLLTEIEIADEVLGSVDLKDLREMSDEELVEVRTRLKELESEIETVRKDRADEVLRERVEPGEKLLGLHRIQSHNKYVAEDVGTVIMRAVSQGVDYTDFVSIDASTLADEHPELAEIGRQEYTYFR